MWRGGFDRWIDWETAPKQWLMTGDGFVFDATDDTVADIAATELVVAGYARQPLTAAVADFHLSTYNHSALYGSPSPAWTGLGAGKTITTLVLALAGADDASSGLICWWPVNGQSDVGDLTFDHDPWNYNGAPLSSGDANTRMIHTAESQIPT
jgi:hypothetical protein